MRAYLVAGLFGLALLSGPAHAHQGHQGNQNQNWQGDQGNQNLMDWGMNQQGDQGEDDSD